MANDIGSVRGVEGMSTQWNTAPGVGANKPGIPTGGGSRNPGDTRPDKPASGPIPMPK